MASTDFFNPKKFDILKIAAVSQYLAQKVIGLTPAQGAAPVIMCCLMAPDELIGEPCDSVSINAAELAYQHSVQCHLHWNSCGHQYVCPIDES